MASTPDVGSSKNKTGGSWIRAHASDNHSLNPNGKRDVI